MSKISSEDLGRVTDGFLKFRTPGEPFAAHVLGFEPAMPGPLIRDGATDFGEDRDGVGVADRKV